MATARMTQMNVRVNTDVKQRAEEVLSLMGSSLTELIRETLEKVAKGASDYDEVSKLLSGTQEDESEDGVARDPIACAPLASSWQAVDTFYRGLGIDPNAPRGEDRSAEQAYEEAMVAQYAEKGWIA